jgi:hypothetical protein
MDENNNAYGSRKLFIRVANRRTQELRRPFRYKIYLLRKGDMPLVADTEISPGDITLQPGETKTEADPNARPDFLISFVEIKTPARGCTTEGKNAFIEE